MKPGLRRLLAVLPLVVMFVVPLAGRPPVPADDDHSGICVGAMQMVACVPPGS